MGLRLNTPPVEVFDLGTTEVFVTENSRASLSRWFKPDSKWHFFFRSTLYHISEMASKMALRSSSSDDDSDTSGSDTADDFVFS